MAQGKKKEKELTAEEKLQRALAPVTEKVHLIPANWRWVKLKSLSLIRTGKKDANYGTQDGQYLFFTCASEPIRCDGYSFEGKAILLAGNGDIGNISLYDGKFEAYQRTYVLSILQELSTEYVFYYFKYRWVDYNVDKMFGTAIPYIRLGNLQSFPIPLAPFSEQQRIVNRIESLFAKLDEAKEKAQAVVDGFEDRKAAILHKAFTGELTERWRKENNINLDSWREVLWGDFLIRIEAGKNWKAEGRPPIHNEFGVVKVSAVTWGEFDELESKTCTDEKQWNSRSQIKVGDFLFSRANTLQLVGNCVIVKSISKRLMLSDKILRFTFDNTVLDEYVLHYTRTRDYRDQIEELASGNQDGMRNVSQKNLRLVRFPTPSLEEQKIVVNVIKNLLFSDASVKEAAEHVIDQIDSMKKSILARAFYGELGTNDPADESAEELLKRIL